MLKIEDVVKNPELMDQFIVENRRLVTMVINTQFRHVINTNDYEDYFQIGCIGLVKSTQKFKPELGHAFSTYAVPMIAGEIRRYKRDYCASTVHVSRGAKDKYYAYLSMKDKDVPYDEICKSLNVSQGQLSEIINCMQELSSLSEVTHTGKDGKELTLGEQVSDSYNLEEDITEKMSLKRRLNLLKAVIPPKAYTTLLLTAKGLTQVKIASKIGVTQVQVSRYLQKAKETYLKIVEEDSNMDRLIDTDQLLNECKVHGTNSAAAKIIAEKHGLKEKQVINLIMNRKIKQRLENESKDLPTTVSKEIPKETPKDTAVSANTTIKEIKAVQPNSTPWRMIPSRFKPEILVSQINNIKFHLSDDSLQIYPSNNLSVMVTIKKENIRDLIDDLKEIEKIISA